MGHVELKEGNNWIIFDKDACRTIGIKPASPVFIFSVSGQEKVFCFQVRHFNETGNVPVGFAMRQTRFSKKMAIRWVYSPEPGYMMYVLGSNKKTAKYELKVKELDYGTIYYIGEWKE